MNRDHIKTVKFGGSSLSDANQFKKVADTANPIAEIGVDLSLDTDFVSLYVEESFVSVLPKDADDSTITIQPHPFAEKVDAPIKKGQVLGTADIVYAEQVIGTVNLVANENIIACAICHKVN